MPHTSTGPIPSSVPTFPESEEGLLPSSQILSSSVKLPLVLGVEGVDKGSGEGQLGRRSTRWSR